MAMYRCMPLVCSIDTLSFTARRAALERAAIVQQREPLFNVQRPHQVLRARSTLAPKISVSRGFAASGLDSSPEPALRTRRDASRKTFAQFVEVDEEEVEESQSSTAALLSACRPDTPRGFGGIVRGVRGFFKRSCFRESMIIA